MQNILLDYFFPITQIEPTAQASTAFLKQACVVVNPNGGGTEGDVTLCTTEAEISAITDNTEVKEILNAGLSRVYVLQSSTLDLDTILADEGQNFYTLIISDDFTDANIDGADFGAFKGVIAAASTTQSWAKAFGTDSKRVGFFDGGSTGAKNLIYAFGKLLSNQLAWRNQQYVTMPYDDSVTTLGAANSLFDDKVSFVLTDAQYGKRLGLFAAGGKAIAAPYIEKDLEIQMQSAALSYISGNQPAYDLKNASLIEDELQNVIDSFIERGYIADGEIEIKLEQDNFVASGYANIAEPKALWRIFGEMKQTL